MVLNHYVVVLTETHLSLTQLKSKSKFKVSAPTGHNMFLQRAI